MTTLKMFYLLLLHYFVLLAETGATESPYEIFKNEQENIMVVTKSPQEYWGVTCFSSRNNRTWLSCDTLSQTDTHYKFDTFGKLYFCFNITFSRKEILNEMKCYYKSDIPIHFNRLHDIQFSSSETADPYKTSLKLKIIPSNELILNVHKVVYRIKYKSEWETNSHWKVKLSTEKHIDLNNLTPFTNYTFMADVRVPEENASWNNPITRYWKTETAAPYPVQRVFQYHESNCPHPTCITVHWQSLPMEYRNDVLTGYCVQYIDGSSSGNNTEQCLDSNNLIVDSLYKEFQDLPRNQALTFSIVAVTESRRMSQPTFIQVKNTDPRKPTAVYVTQISDQMYNVSWLIEQAQEAVNVTVFRCQNENSSSNVRCRDEGEWITVANISYLLVNYSSKKQPVFAAYVSTEEGRSALTKAECIFTPGNFIKPQKPNIYWSETKLSFTWPTLYCSDWNGIPVAYILHFAEGKNCENGKKKQFPVNGTKPVESDVVIHDLSPDTEYSVCIQLKTKDGLSLMSDTTTGITKYTDSHAIYVYSILSLVMGLFIISVILMCIRSSVKYVTSLEISTINRVNSYTDLDYNYEEIQNDENQLMDDSKYKFPQTNESGYYSFNNSSGTENSHFPSKDFSKSTIQFVDYLQVNELTGKLVDKLKNVENINVTTTSLCNKADDIEKDSNETGYIDASEDYKRLCRPPESVPTCVDGNMKETVSCRADYIDEPNGSFSETSSMSLPTCVDGNTKETVSCRTGYIDDPIGSFSEISSMSLPTCVDDNMKATVSFRKDYVDEPDKWKFTGSTMSLPTCVDSNIKENVSIRTDYIDEPDSSFSEFPSMSIPTCVNGNMKENVSCRTDYVDEQDNSFSVLSVPTDVNGNLMNIDSSSPDYVDEPNDLTKLVPNSIPPCKNTSSDGSITDYILSEPNYISEIPEESTNSYNSKPLKGQILQTENENNQIETSKFNGRRDEENVKMKCNGDYVPHGHIVEAMESSFDEVQAKNIQNEKQRISQNPMSSCNLVNDNVDKPSDSLQRQDKKMNKIHDTEQITGTLDYVKTESFLGYVPNEISH